MMAIKEEKGKEQKNNKEEALFIAEGSPLSNQSFNSLRKSCNLRTGVNETGTHTHKEKGINANKQTSFSALAHGIMHRRIILADW